MMESLTPKTRGERLYCYFPNVKQLQYLGILVLLQWIALPTGIAQCPPGGITLLTQADVDNFSTNFPGCNSLPGGLTIGPSTDITNLNGLLAITEIAGLLNIIDNPLLANLNGLANVTTTGGGLNVIRNNNLTTLSGLSSLSAVEDRINISFNDQLTDFDFSTVTTSNMVVLQARNNPLLLNGWFPTDVTSLSGSLFYWENPFLNDISEMNSLTSIGGELFLGHTLDNNFPDFPSLTSIGGGMVIAYNPNITEIPAMSALNSIEGRINISYNDRLERFDLSTVTTNNIIQFQARNNPELHTALFPTDVSSIAGTLMYWQNPLLDSISHMDNLTTIGAEFFLSHTRLTSLPDYPSLINVQEGMIIAYNDNITAIPALPLLDSLGGRINISFNNQLSSFDLSMVNTNNIIQMQVRNNPLLQTALLPTDVSNIAGTLMYWQNPLLNSISDMNNLTHIDGELFLGHTLLSTFPSFPSLTNIGQGLIIAYNPNITAIPAFATLNSIGGRINISYNEELLSFDLSAVSTHDINQFQARNNPELQIALFPTDVTSIAGTLMYWENPKLNNISPMNNLTRVGLELFLSHTLLPSFPNYPNLSHIHQGLILIGNPNISAIPTFPVLDYLGGRINISFNEQLSSFDLAGVKTHDIIYLEVRNNPGLNSGLLPTDVSSTSSYILYHQNPLLEDLSEMANLTKIGGYLGIHNTAACELPNFPNLDSIKHGFRIIANSNITRLPTLSSTTVIDSTIRITNNPLLSYCSIASVCNYLAGIGERVIQNNTGDCWDEAAVNVSCLAPLPYPGDLDGDGYTECEGDCNDTNAAIHPGMEEICDGIDNDCDGQIDEGFDLDGDGYTVCEGDCDDEDPNINPEQSESGSEACCGTVVEETLNTICSPTAAYAYSFSLQNFTPQTVTAVFIHPVPGYTFSNQYWTQTSSTSLPIVANGGISGPLHLTIQPNSPITTSTVLCFGISYYSEGEECCYFEYCITLETEDPCTSIDVIPTTTDSDAACCYAIEIVNEYCDDYFIGIETEIISPGSTFIDYSGGGNWDPAGATDGTSVTWWPSGSVIPTGSLTGINFCLPISTEPQEVVFHWLAIDSLTEEVIRVCSDTLEFFCNPCIRIKEDGVSCEDGNYNYSFVLQNNSAPAHMATSILFEVHTPGVYFDPAYINTTLNAGEEQFLSLGIESDFPLSPGDVISYKILLVDENGWCCHLDGQTLTIPECSDLGNALEGEGQRPEQIAALSEAKINLYPNPAHETTFIDLASYEGKSGNIRLLDNLGQVQWSMAIDEITAVPISLSLEGMSASYYLIQVEIEGVPLAPKPLVILHP